MFVYRIVIADGEETSLKQLKSLVQKLGHTVVAEARDGLSALTGIRSTRPDLVIMDVQLPGMESLELAKIIDDNRLAATIMLSSTASEDLLQKLKDSWIFSVLIKPVNEYNLLAAIEMAKSRFDKIVELEKQVSELQESLNARTVVDKAKALLIKKMNMTESEAYKHIQSLAMNKRVSKKAIAEAILLSLSD